MRARSCRHRRRSSVRRSQPASSCGHQKWGWRIRDEWSQCWSSSSSNGTRGVPCRGGRGLIGNPADSCVTHWSVDVRGGAEGWADGVVTAVDATKNWSSRPATPPMPAVPEQAVSGLLRDAVDRRIVLGDLVQLLLDHRRREGQLAVLVDEHGLLAVVPRGVLAIAGQPPFLDLRRHLALGRAWCRSTVVVGGRCRRARHA